jgi:hypothetical protein
MKLGERLQKHQTFNLGNKSNGIKQLIGHKHNSFAHSAQQLVKNKIQVFESPLEKNKNV